MNEFYCGQCGSCFTRQEHLARHARTHTQEKPHACLECGKSFSRLDALRRHAASHKSTARITSGFSRACRQCAASRARCTRDEPCQRCSEKDILCEYPRTRRKGATTGTQLPSRLHEIPGTSGGAQNTSLSGDTCIDYGAMATFVGQETLGQPPEYCSAPNDFSQVHIIESAVYGSTQPSAMSAMNWLPPVNSTTMGWGPYHTGIPDPDPSNEFGLSSTQLAEPIDQSTACTNNSAYNEQGWLPPQDGEDMALSCREPTTCAYESSESPSVSERPITSSRSPQTQVSGEATLYVEGASTRLPFKGRCASSRRKSSIAANIASIADDEDYPEETEATDVASVVSRRRAEGVLTGYLSAEAFSHLVLQIQSTSVVEGIAISEGTLPMIGYVRAFFRLYFRRFHPAWPFLPPTLTHYEQPSRWLLLLAVIAIGSRYSPGKQCAAYSRPLCDLLSRFAPRLLSELQQRLSVEGQVDQEAAQGHRREDDLATLQATVLNIVYRSHNGRSSSPKEAFSLLFSAAETCRDMGLLTTSDTPITEQIPPLVLKDWINKQLKIRTGLMIWALDSAIAFEFSRQPLFFLDDASCSLPCRRSLWESPSYDHILASTKYSVTIPKALEIMYIEKGLPPGTDDLGTNILVSAVCRRTKEAFQQYRTPLASWVPTADVRHWDHESCSTTGEAWPPSLTILLKWRNSACDCLDLLHWNANGAVAKAGGWEHPAVLNLHLSRLLILAPIHDLHQITASGSLQHDALGTNRLLRRGQIQAWACNDQHKARLSVVHAGALLWHVRRYRVGSFLEPFAAFMATLVVWAYSSALQLQTKRNQIADANASQEPASEDRVPFLHLDRPLDDELVQEFVTSGLQMVGHISGVGDVRAEGAPGKVLKMGANVLSDLKHTKHLANDEDPESLLGDDRNGVWGIEQFYIDRLERLRGSTERA